MSSFCIFGGREELSWYIPKKKQKFGGLSSSILPQTYVAKFECEIEDAPNVTFKWFKDGLPIKDGDKYRIISRFSTSCLELLSPTKDDSGEYTCKASNQHGSDECSASLCQVDEDTGVTVTWTRDGRKVHQSPDCKLSFEDKTVSLDILKTTLKDCGNYVCTVANEAGSATCSTLVKVQGKGCLVDFHGYCSIWSCCKSAVLKMNTSL
uniref:Ig-like domain-containing protein n=1 Tax=Mastacembelus armatus TaxID=205130 RepID=A0A3Q3MR35_9TELE